jgi:hypothetical protein
MTVVGKVSVVVRPWQEITEFDFQAHFSLKAEANVADLESARELARILYAKGEK